MSDSLTCIRCGKPIKKRISDWRMCRDCFNDYQREKQAQYRHPLATIPSVAEQLHVDAEKLREFVKENAIIKEVAAE